MVWSHRVEGKQIDKCRCICSGWDFMTRAQQGVVEERMWRESCEFIMYENS